MNELPRFVHIWPAIWLCVIGSTCCGQPAVAPAVSGIEQYIEETREAWDVPGLAVAVIHENKVVLAKGFGTRELDADAQVDADTVFAIASNTKAFTAVALAILVEEGQLEWDDPVREYLPYFDLSDEYATEHMTIRDLLCHRSGLGTFSGDLLWYGTPYSVEEVLRRARHLTPASSFRGAYGYSNLMFMAAGEVVAVASGQPWDEFVHTRILRPLSMRRTVTSVTELPSLDNVATPHKKTRTSPRPIEWMNWDTMAAAGGIISSVNDMAKWLRLQLRAGQLHQNGSRLFSDDSSRLMWSAHTVIPISRRSQSQFPSTHFRAYGLGWDLRDYHGTLLVSHGGGYDGMFSRVTMVPESSLGIIVLTNSMTGVSTPITFRVLDQYLGVEATDWSQEMLPSHFESRDRFFQRIDRTIKPVADAAGSSRSLTAYAGTYSCPMYGEAEVSVEDNQLLMQLLPNQRLLADLSHLHYDTFVIRWRNEFAWFDEGTAQFVPDSRGRFVKLKLSVPNDDLWFHELRLSR